MRQRAISYEERELKKKQFQAQLGKCQKCAAAGTADAANLTQPLLGILSPLELELIATWGSSRGRRSNSRLTVPGFLTRRPTNLP